MSCQILKSVSLISLLALTLAGCSMLQKKVDASEEQTTDSGFQFRFAMSGDWYPAATREGLYMVGQKPQEDGSSKVAVVRHGPIHTPGGKKMTGKEMLEGFMADIEKESEGGRVLKVKNKFSQTKHEGANCLLFEQTGQDQLPTGALNMNNDGMICLHPTRPYQFVWMALSERWPIEKNRSSEFTQDKKAFFDSLKFVK